MVFNAKLSTKTRYYLVSSACQSFALWVAKARKIQLLSSNGFCSFFNFVKKLDTISILLRYSLSCSKTKTNPFLLFLFLKKEVNFITQIGHSPKVSQGQPDSDKTSKTIHSRKAILSFVHYFVWIMESTRMMLCDMEAKHRR